MATNGFSRHTRACVDAAIHRILARTDHPELFRRLVRSVQRRSSWMRRPPSKDGELSQVRALRDLATFEAVLLRAPETWEGADGHPLLVVDSLARQLFSRYPTPRFLAWAFLSGGAEQQRWFIAHARGQRFRSLPLPLPMTRRMEDLFLRTPDPFVVPAALRRAEILSLGGTPALTQALLQTSLAEQFPEPLRWRSALQWLVRSDAERDLDAVPAVIDFIGANPEVSLRGRTFSSLLRKVREWHERLAVERGGLLRWSRSRWQGLVVVVAPSPFESRAAQWTMTELLDSRELRSEGRTMHHCVVSYARHCHGGRSSLWSLRHRWEGEEVARPVLTVEVHPGRGEIVQVRGPFNAPARGLPLSLVQRWAQQQGLRLR